MALCSFKVTSPARYLLLFMLLCSTCAIASPEPIKIISRGDANAEHALGMLKLALSKTDKNYTLDVTEGALTGSRQLQNLIEGKIHIAWTATNAEHEDAALAIRVPLYKGLLGYRVMIIHRDNPHVFDGVRSLSELSHFKLGQGKGWTDTTILRDNGLQVVTANKYESLFYMTDGHRFDGFPRGVNEPWAELASRPDLELTVDENIMLVYKMPFYLFVTPTREALAADIRRGMDIALNDGSFDNYFMNSPTVKMVLSKVDMSSRRTFELHNPDLPSATPVADKRLWFDVMMAKQQDLQPGKMP